MRRNSKLLSPLLGRSGSMYPARKIAAGFLYGLRPVDLLLASALAIVAVFRVDEWAVMADDSSDLATYSRHFANAVAQPFLEAVTYGHEPLYASLAWIFANLGADYQTFIDAISILLALGFYLFARRLLRGRSILAAVCIAAFVGSPIFEQFANILRQALATGFLLPALALIWARRWKAAAILSALAVASHTSSVILLSLGVAALYIQGRDRLLLTVGVATVAAYAADLTSQLTTHVITPILAFAGIYTKYTDTSSWAFETGSKLTFLVAGAFVMLTSGGVIVSRRSGEEEQSLARYLFLVCCAFMLGSGLPYYSRIALVAFSLFPIAALVLAEVFLFRRTHFLGRILQ